MTSLYDQITTPENVNLAWKRLRNDKAPWQVGLRDEDFRNDQLRHLLELIEALRDGGYRPDPLRQFPHKKADGKTRVLSALNLRDKLAQRMLLNVVEPLGEALFHPDSYAYRPGRNVAMAVAKTRERIRCSLTWLVDTDIESYFDRIPHKQLAPLVKKHIPDKRVRDLILLWLKTHSLHNGLFDGRRGIPQGAIISPFLCNLYLTGFDNALTDKGISFVRYADDFVLFTAERAQAHQAQKYAEGLLADLGLKLKTSKTRIAGPGSKMQFLGETIQVGGNPPPPKKQKRTPAKKPKRFLGKRR